LFEEVSCRTKHGAFFNQVAGFKQANSLSGDTTVTKDPKSTGQDNPLAEIAMVDRGDESNITFNPSQIPKVVTASAVKHGDKNYLSGYVPMQANNKNFNFTSFHVGEMPHLISQDYFEKNRADTAPVGDGQAIPNAFKIDGTVQATQGTMGAVACAVANPQRQYQLAIPHSYIVINFHNTAKWFVEGKQTGQKTYGNKPEGSKQIVKQKQLSTGGFLDGFASLGNEYASGGSLWQMYNALPGDHMTPLQKILQRVQEIDPNYSMTQLQGLMTKTNFDPTVSSYFIFPVYHSPDCSDPSIQIAPANGALPAWLSINGPPLDGLQMSIGDETMTKDAPNTCTDYITGGPFSSDKHYTQVSGRFLWTPGSGYGQCLGVMQMARLTEIYFTGQPN
ncbi:MAG: hypothetical protein JSS83_14435, partial [Cyanobacteria bacterium SZAS LIN-3]|nr:hypothetical protein [Cyanobacteria bacterium SZAS LIN-3]